MSSSTSGRLGARGSARSRAAERQRRANAERDQRDAAERNAVAAFEIAQEKRERGQRIIDTAEPAMGAAIEAILATGASTQRVQVLLDLSEGEVRKLRKRAAATGSAPASPVPVRARGAGSAPGAAAGSGAGAPGSSAGAEQPRDDQDEAGKPSP